MTREENIRAILECYFTGFKDEIIDSACERLCEFEYKPYICDTCTHKDAEWDTEPCDGCCKNHSGYEPTDDKCHYCEHNFTPYQGNTGEFKEQQESMREFTEEEVKAYSKALDKMYKPTGFNVFDEPTDAISREAVMRLIENKPYDWSNLTERHNMLMEIRKLPSVTRQTEYYPPCEVCHKKMDEIRRTYDKLKEQEPYDDAVSRGAFEQVMYERDIAIEQLHELGYEFGQKIEPCDDAISRQYLLDNCVVDKVTMPYVPISKIENAPSVRPQEPISRWIPVSERLPEEDTAVLIWCTERRNIYCAYLEEKQWWIFGAYFQKVPLEVIAWMPLPEPYEPQESEVQE